MHSIYLIFVITVVLSSYTFVTGINAKIDLDEVVANRPGKPSARFYNLAANADDSYNGNDEGFQQQIRHIRNWLKYGGLGKKASTEPLLMTRFAGLGKRSTYHRDEDIFEY
ncbi:hypothetical protein HELRODRAFT_173735 [Helobdella robusta]|uniref:Uncharacterized protein n=1 Tax=Helobdella robusta TaxID=6412 RepID=T1F764_HELRO|nr:hypothetical protein HELRODRAFT_173735 [Helobdella robusta]ESO03440.1 hypothetical protein HELRODRAFT_173735 [Helobdella robusta]